MTPKKQTKNKLKPKFYLQSSHQNGQQAQPKSKVRKKTVPVANPETKFLQVAKIHSTSSAFFVYIALKIFS